MIHETSSSKKTKKLAFILAQEIFSHPSFLKEKFGRANMRKSALIICLSGELGAGKTTFVQGFMKGAGIRQRITSPSFTLIKNYELRIKNYGNYKKVYHIDCYRLHKPKELSDLELEEILNNPQNIVLIEWPERIKKYLLKNAIWIKFNYGKKENERKITITSQHKIATQI